MTTVILSIELVEALEAKLKEQSATIARLTAELEQCKHVLDDDVEEDVEICECGHPMSEHSHKYGAGCLVLLNDRVFCECEVTQ